MDLICPKCAEPVDNDYLHDLVEEGMFSDYTEALHSFQLKGCVGIGETHNEQTMGSYRAAVSDAMFDLLGDDSDGAMSMMEDFEMMGLV